MRTRNQLETSGEKIVSRFLDAKKSRELYSCSEQNYGINNEQQIFVKQSNSKESEKKQSSFSIGGNKIQDNQISKIIGKERSVLLQSAEIKNDSISRNQQILRNEVQDNNEQVIKRIPSKLFDLCTNLRLKKIMNNFLESLESRRFKFLSAKQHSLIQDKSSGYFLEKQIRKVERDPKQSSCWARVKNLMEKYLEVPIEIVSRVFGCFPIIQPQSQFKFYWNVLQLIAIVIFFFHIPLSICFGKPFGTFSHSIVLLISLLIILLDIIINFNTGFFRKGEFVMSRFLIAKNYLSNLLIYDIISIVPIVLIFLSESMYSKYTMVLFAFKFRNFRRTFLKLEEGIRMNQLAVHILQILKVLFVIIIISHIFASVWIFFGILETDQNQLSWISHGGVRNISLGFSPSLNINNWTQVYLQSFYFIILTMLTVGYGDLVPHSSYEMIACIILMIISSCIYAYTLNTLMEIFYEMSRESEQIRRDLRILNNYLDLNKIPTSLKFQVREYLEYYWCQNNQNKIDIEKRILSQLSVNLRQNLLIEANKIILKDSPIFNKNFSQKFLTKILSVIQVFHYTPEQDIFIQNQIDQTDIFFIEKGKVELYANLSRHANIFGKKKPKQRQLMILGEGASFGTQSFFTGFPRSHSARSVNFTKVRVIQRQQFLSILQEFPADYEQFCKIKDLITFSNDTSKIGQLCFCCENSTKHSFSACPYIHHVNNRFKTVKRANLATNTRNPFQRKQMNKFPTLMQHVATQEEVVKFHNRFLLEDSFPKFRSSKITSADKSGTQLLKQGKKRKNFSSEFSLLSSSTSSLSSSSSTSSAEPSNIPFSPQKVSQLLMDSSSSSSSFNLNSSDLSECLSLKSQANQPQQQQTYDQRTQNDKQRKCIRISQKGQSTNKKQQMKDSTSLLFMGESKLLHNGDEQQSISLDRINKQNPPKSLTINYRNNMEQIKSINQEENFPKKLKNHNEIVTTALKRLSSTFRFSKKDIRSEQLQTPNLNIISKSPNNGTNNQQQNQNQIQNRIQQIPLKFNKHHQHDQEEHRIENLDKLCSYVNYFPKDNFETMIQKVNTINQKHKIQKMVRKKQRKRLPARQMNFSQDFSHKQDFSNLIKFNEINQLHLQRKQFYKRMVQSNVNFRKILERSDNNKDRLLMRSVNRSSTPKAKEIKSESMKSSPKSMPDLVPIRDRIGQIQLDNNLKQGYKFSVNPCNLQQSQTLIYPTNEQEVQSLNIYNSNSQIPLNQIALSQEEPAELDIQILQ